MNLIGPESPSGAAMNCKWLLVGMMVCGSACAMDANGTCWQGGGVGSLSCPDFLESMDESRRHQSGTRTAVEAVGPFVMYLAGFQTANNMQAAGTCDVFVGRDAKQPLAWAQNYCRSNPLQRFGDAVRALAVGQYPRRSRACSAGRK